MSMAAGTDRHPLSELGQRSASGAWTFRTSVATCSRCGRDGRGWDRPEAACPPDCRPAAGGADRFSFIQALGNLTWTFIGWMRDAIGDAQLIRELLDGVEDILAMGASAAEVPLSEFVADNFTRMAASGWGRTEDVG
jgi:hypothetical protein